MLPDASYTTGIGEHRNVLLADGSIVYLSAKSSADIRFSEKSREIELEGEALFEVKHDADRPFRVTSGNTVTQAIGTEFNVRMRPSGTTVAVIEGIVKVDALPVANAPRTTFRQGVTRTELRESEQLKVDAQGVSEKGKFGDPAEILSWRERRLNFVDSTIQDIAEEFNRWNQLQIHLEGLPNNTRYDGFFDAGDLDSILDFLSRDESLYIERRPDQIVIRKKAGTANH